MKITLTQAYFDKGDYKQFIITQGMTTETELQVNDTIGSLILVKASELARFALPENKHLGDAGMGDYPFLEGEYVKVNPFSFWNKLKSGKLFK